MNIYNELKVFSMIVGLHTLVISLCALVLQFVFIAYVFFLTGTWMLILCERYYLLKLVPSVGLLQVLVFG